MESRDCCVISFAGRRCLAWILFNWARKPRFPPGVFPPLKVCARNEVGYSDGNMIAAVGVAWADAQAVAVLLIFGSLF